MTSTEVAIVGGGPAGLAAAIRLRERGFACTVLERAEAPVDKACGEGLMPKGLRELDSLGALELVDRARSAPFEGIRYLQEDGTSVEARFANGSGLGIRRLALAQALKARATALGAGFLQCAARAAREDSKFVVIETDQGVIEARLAVGADGLHSLLRRAAGLEVAEREPRPLQRFGLRRHYAIAPWSPLVEVHWQDGAEAYVTPAGPASINLAFLWHGSGAAGEHSTFESLLSRFPLLRDRLQGAPPESEARGAGPLLRPVPGVASRGGRIALLGDAAGYVDAITGQGLSLALSGASLLAASLPRDLDQAGLRRGLAGYQTELRRRFRAYAWPARALLWLARHPGLRRRTLRGLAAQPRLFSKLLEVVA